jgi:hypothetical protein
MRYCLSVCLTLLLATAASADTSTTIANGTWSNPLIWDVQPDRTRDVVIKHAVTADKGEARRVDVAAGATLTLTGNLDLYDGSLVNRGTLTGASGVLAFHVSNDRTFTGNTIAGPDPAWPDDHSSTDFGLWSMDGSKTSLIGPAVTPWLDVLPFDGTGTALKYGAFAAKGIAGGMACLSDAPQGWQADDQLLLVSPKGTYALATLTDVSCDLSTHTVSFSGADAFVADVVKAEGRMVLPKIANLSRRLAIVGADVKQGDSNHRAHSVFMGHVTARLQAVEFRNLGPRAKLGRYPIHFHHSHTIGECVVQGCSVWQDQSDPGSRFVSIHDTTEVQLLNNVGLLSHGHGYFCEMGTEISNVITGNLSVDVRGPEELKVANADLTIGTHHYWLRSGNTVSGNVAAGGSPGGFGGTNGFSFLAHTVKFHPAMPAVHIDSQMLGCPYYGHWCWGFGLDYQAVNPVAAYCGASSTGDGYQGTWTIVNPTCMFNGLGTSQYQSQIFLNYHKNITVTGGLLVGDVGTHLHYFGTGTFTDTTFRGKTLMNPTYWVCAVTYTNPVLTCDAAVAGAYPRAKVSPGVVRVNGATGTVGGVVYTAAKPLTADYILNDGTYYTALRSVPNGTDLQTRRLLDPLPTTGFIRLPANLPLYTTKWGIAAAGSPVVSLNTLTEDEATWKAAGAPGYPFGQPPGNFDVRVVRADGTEQVWKNVKVIAGATTVLDP